MSNPTPVSFPLLSAGVAGGGGGGVAGGVGGGVVSVLIVASSDID